MRFEFWTISTAPTLSSYSAPQFVCKLGRRAKFLRKSATSVVLNALEAAFAHFSWDVIGAEHELWHKSQRQACSTAHDTTDYDSTRPTPAIEPMQCPKWRQNGVSNDDVVNMDTVLSRAVGHCRYHYQLLLLVATTLHWWRLAIRKLDDERWTLSQL